MVGLAGRWGRSRLLENKRLRDLWYSGLRVMFSLSTLGSLGFLFDDPEFSSEVLYVPEDSVKVSSEFKMLIRDV